MYKGVIFAILKRKILNRGENNSLELVINSLLVMKMHYIIFLGVSQESQKTNPNQEHCCSKENAAGIIVITILE